MADRSREFLTETASLRTLSFPTANQVDWGFRIGLGLVALFAAAEIASVGYYYAGQARLGHRTTQPAVIATAPSPAAAAPEVAPATTPAIAPSVAAVPASPAPAAATLSPADQLLQEAKTLRERGDTTTALARLQ